MGVSTCVVLCCVVLFCCSDRCVRSVLGWSSTRLLDEASILGIDSHVVVLYWTGCWAKARYSIRSVIFFFFRDFSLDPFFCCCLVAGLSIWASGLLSKSGYLIWPAVISKTVISGWEKIPKYKYLMDIWVRQTCHTFLFLPVQTHFWAPQLVCDLCCSLGLDIRREFARSCFVCIFLCSTCCCRVTGPSPAPAGCKKNDVTVFSSLGENRRQAVYFEFNFQGQVE